MGGITASGKFVSQEMTMSKHFRPKLWDEPKFEDEPDGDRPPGPVTCNRCGEEDLEWIDIGSGKWRLYPIDDKKPHVCKPDASDFGPIKS